MVEILLKVLKDIHEPGFRERVVPENVVGEDDYVKTVVPEDTTIPRVISKSDAGEGSIIECGIREVSPVP